MRNSIPSGAVIGIVTNNDGVITGSSGERTTVTDMMFYVANDSSLRDRSERKDVSNHQIRFLPTENELAGVHALSGDKQLLLVLVAERMTECDASQRSTTAGIVDDFGDDTLEVTIAFAKVEAAEPGRPLPVVGMGLEDRPCSLTLCPNHTSHF